MKIKHRPLHALALSALCLAALAPASALEAQVESSDDVRIAEGSKTFRAYCASCHGFTGKGDGVMADILKVPPADLTKIAARRGGDFPDDEIHAIIDGREDVRGHGSREMPAWGDAFKYTDETEDEAVVAEKITQLVYFLKSIQE